MRRILGVVSIFFLATSFVAPAVACSLAAGTFIGSNFEMIEASDAIVVARAEAEEEVEKSLGNRLRFKVETVLKGKPGETVFGGGYFGEVEPSDEAEIVRAHPDAFGGACHRINFEGGRVYVLMLREYQGEYRVSGDPFSRLAEDDFGPDSPWRRAIQIYLDIQSDPDRMAQIGRLQVIAEAGLREGASEFEKALGEDAFSHLTGIHPDKPTEYLVKLYEDPLFPMRTLDDVTEGTAEASIDQMTEFLFGEPGVEDDVRSTVLRALAQGEHPTARPMFEDILARAHPPESELGAAIVFLIRQQEYDRAKSVIGAHLLWLAATQERGVGNVFANDIATAIGYGENIKVPQAFADWWGEQRLALCLIKTSLYSCYSERDDVEDLLHDAEANAVLLKVKARSPLVQAWADNRITELRDQDVSLYEEDWKLPLDLLVAGYDRNKASMIESFACGTSTERWILAARIGEASLSNAESLLRQMMAMPQTDEMREQLFDAGVKLAASDMAQSQWADAKHLYAYAQSGDVLPLSEWQKATLPCLKAYLDGLD